MPVMSVRGLASDKADFSNMYNCPVRGGVRLLDARRGPFLSGNSQKTPAGLQDGVPRTDVRILRELEDEITRGPVDAGGRSTHPRAHTVGLRSPPVRGVRRKR